MIKNTRIKSNKALVHLLQRRENQDTTPITVNKYRIVYNTYTCDFVVSHPNIGTVGYFVSPITAIEHALKG